ncbi:hypothetical protein EV144_106256 [Flavobacterium sp. 270]|uniref:hypothetical protein n=1 Tax=Flavobacterium sp. 270 TaxID=2512114 RepID=UPI001066B36F|nr:hypothetical protein [Flavobacterium sp. 270]TDW46584.1 hypothetical protein EV144_106256 [Flavobacterium sp. 270]
MKKLILLFLVLISYTGFSQVTIPTEYTIQNPLRLNTVNAGTKSDSILVRGADKIVKYVPQSSIGGDAGSSQKFGVEDTNATGNRNFNLAGNNFNYTNVKEFNLGGNSEITFVSEATSTFITNGSEFSLVDKFMIDSEIDYFGSVSTLLIKLTLDDVVHDVIFTSTEVESGTFRYVADKIPYTTIGETFQYPKIVTSSKITMAVPSANPSSSNNVAYFDGLQLKRGRVTFESVLNANSTSRYGFYMLDNSNPTAGSTSIDKNSILLYSDLDGDHNSEYMIWLRENFMHIYGNTTAYREGNEDTVIGQYGMSMSKVTDRVTANEGDKNWSNVPPLTSYRSMENDGSELNWRGNILDFTNYGSVNNTPQFRFPVKPEGNYTLATLDDITGGGGSQNITQVLQSGNIVTEPLFLEFSNGDFSTNRTNIESGGITVYDTNDITNNTFGYTWAGGVGYNDLEVNYFISHDGFSFKNQSDLNKSVLREQTNNTISERIILLPNHEGTLATNDDITLQKTLDTGNTAIADGGSSQVRLLSQDPNNRRNLLFLSGGDNTSNIDQRINSINLSVSTADTALASEKNPQVLLEKINGLTLAERNIETGFRQRFYLPQYSGLIGDTNYTLATTQDTEKDLQQVLDNGGTVYDRGINLLSTGSTLGTNLSTLGAVYLTDEYGGTGALNTRSLELTDKHEGSYTDKFTANPTYIQFDKADSFGSATLYPPLETVAGVGQYYLPKTSGTLVTVIAVDNGTTSALSSSNLTTSYPDAIRGFRVQCMSIAGGAKIYEKTATGWAEYSVTAAP